MRNKQVLDAVDLETAPWERQTTGAWIDVPKPVLDSMRSRNINATEAIHAAQHAFLNRFPMAADLRTECKAVRHRRLSVCDTFQLNRWV
jgi:DEAD/DEAH box helicase domain-containing protein